MHARVIIVIVVILIVVLAVGMAIGEILEEDLYKARMEELRSLNSLLDQAQKQMEFTNKENFLLKERIAELEAQFKEQRE